MQAITDFRDGREESAQALAERTANERRQRLVRHQELQHGERWRNEAPRDAALRQYRLVTTPCFARALEHTDYAVPASTVKQYVTERGHKTWPSSKKLLGC